MIKMLFILSASLLFIGCDTTVFEDREIIALKAKNEKELLQKRIEIERLRNERLALETEYKKSRDARQIESNRQKDIAIATLKNKERLKELEIKRELKKIELEKEQLKESRLIEQRTLLRQQQRELEFRRYIVALVALVAIIVAFFIYYYLKRKREDKLIAYNDNLKKYFMQKENETKLKIAEKILDTVASGNLSAEDQRKLIEVMHKSASREKMLPEELPDEAVDVQVIENRSEEK